MQHKYPRSTPPASQRITSTAMAVPMKKPCKTPWRWQEADPSAYVQDGRVYFTQIPAL